LGKRHGFCNFQRQRFCFRRDYRGQPGRGNDGICQGKINRE